jgi:hypothetical protein
MYRSRDLERVVAMLVREREVIMMIGIPRVALSARTLRRIRTVHARHLTSSRMQSVDVLQLLERVTPSLAGRIVSLRAWSMRLVILRTVSECHT